MNKAMIMMGGSGTRFAADIPKQFIEVDGRPIFSYLVEAYENFADVDEVYIVCHKDWVEFTESWVKSLSLEKVRGVVVGGTSRSQSVQFGLAAMLDSTQPDDIVLIHDVTHPFIDEDNVGTCIRACRECGASTLAGSCFDTMYTVDDEGFIASIEDRSRLVSATAPECFRFGTIYPLYKDKTADELETMTSAGAMLVSSGHPVRVVRTPLINLKITLQEDMEAFKKLLHGYYYK